MRKILAVALVAAGTSSAALAADLPVRSAPVFVPPPPVFTWSGGYFGINAGYAFDYNSRFNTFNDPATAVVGGRANGVGLTRPGVANVSSDGFTAGGQIGYNYQFGAGNGILVGFEADAAYTDLGRTNNYLITNPANGVSRFSTLHTDMDFLGTVRGRLGYAFDRFLVYGTGGFAYGDVTTATRFYGGTSNASNLTYFGRRSTIDTGYTYGGGVEYAMPTGSFLNFFHSSAVTVKAEYLHYDLGSEGTTVAHQTGNNSNYTQRIRTDGDLARVGLNYKF